MQIRRKKKRKGVYIAVVHIKCITHADVYRHRGMKALCRSDYCKLDCGVKETHYNKSKETEVMTLGEGSC